MLILKPEKIKYLIVHHTATSRDTTTFVTVKNYHIKTQGWEDIGYHYFINGAGQLQAGRDEKWVGAHAKTYPDSMNYRSLGVALTGNFENEQPSQAQIDTLTSILDKLRIKYSIPRVNVLGHKEIPHSTACPGKNLLPFLKHYREQTDAPKPCADEDLQQRSKALDEIIEILKNHKFI
jgi:hypothetical protein